MLTQVVPNPPDAGPKVKTHYTLRTLAEAHEVELVTFVRDQAEVQAARELTRWCSRVIAVPLRRQKSSEPYYVARGWLTGAPFLVARDRRSAMVNAIAQRLNSGEINILHADQLTMAQYLWLAYDTPTKTIFDAHNAVWQLVREMADRQPTPLHRLASHIEWRLLRRFEGAACRLADMVITVSDRDRRALEEAANAALQTVTIPIGIEVREQTPIEPEPGRRRLLSVATMHYPPNAEALRWFRDQVWPHLHSRHPQLRLDVVGARPPADLRQWSDDDPNIAVHGYVTDLDEFYEHAVAFIVPLLSGSGIRVKILEAMARGLPVVSTSVGADGLDVTDGEHLLIADDPRSFAKSVSRLYESESLQRTLSEAARQRVLERYDWRLFREPLLQAYDALGQF